jgi:excisionase family DNA binding protein
LSLDSALQAVVAEAVRQTLAPYLRRLADPEPLVYSVSEAAHVLSTSTNTVRRLVDEGVLPIVPHMGQRILIPRRAVGRLVEASMKVCDADAPNAIPAQLAAGA